MVKCGRYRAKSNPYFPLSFPFFRCPSTSSGDFLDDGVRGVVTF